LRELTEFLRARRWEEVRRSWRWIHGVVVGRLRLLDEEASDEEDETMISCGPMLL